MSASAAGSPQRRVRVRLAPSPTGYIHVGTARNALYNWAFARQHGGDFILRIEDTDTERSEEEWVEGILAGLRWIGTDWDEGPYRQSERREHYEGALDTLWDAGRIYACDCTRDEVLARTKGNAIPGYDGHCRGRELERGPGRALRFAVSQEGTTVVHDLVRGDVEFSNSTIEDFVVAKSNGDALFVLAVVVDDREMRISHVIRSEEHLPTTPKAVLLWEALGTATGDRLELPAFAHLPLLVNDKRQKISKRRGDRVALEDYEALGYLPEAMDNYLSLLGWTPPGGEEFFTVADLVRDFRLEAVNHSPAFFDDRRLLHYNGIYIRNLATSEFSRRVQEWAARTADHLGADCYDTPAWEALAPLVQERVATLSEVPSYVEFLFAKPFAVDKESYEKAIARDEEALSILSEAREGYGALGSWTAAELKAVLEAVAERHGRKLGKAQAPVRVATLGRSVGLPLFESLEVLGREETVARIEAVRARSAG